MTTAASNTPLVGKETSINWIQRFIWIVVFLACGLLVFVVFGHYYPTFKGNTDAVGRVLTALVFLVAAIAICLRESFRKY